MSSFSSVFGEDQGSAMEERHGCMVGLIPHLLVNPSRSQLRAAHGIELRSSRDESVSSYETWRMILHAKFAEGTAARAALLSTGDSYIIDREPGCDEWSAKVVYPSAPSTHGEGVEGCTCSGVPGASSMCSLTREYNRAKRERTRVGGSLVGNNRMGKYIMAVRSEIRVLELEKGA
jgi:predicted NAD-dependent protein-ADP-ribosyltransferase YbiA (DUF1768 family)